MGRKVEGMVQTTIWLPEQMHRRLKQIAGSGGVSEEIRRRLEASDKVSRDPGTAELVDAIAYAADETASYYGSWSEDAFAFEVLTGCVDLLLKTYRPKGEARANPTEFGEIFFGSTPSSPDISRSIVGDWVRARARRADEGKRR